MHNPADLVGAGMLAVAFAAGAAILLLAPGKATNRLLALVIVVDALAWLASDPGDLLHDAGAMHAGEVFEVAFTDAMPALYLLFLGSALDLPWLRPLRNRWVRPLLLGYAAVAAALAIGSDPGTAFSAYRPRSVFQLGNTGMGLAYLVGLLAAVWSARRSEPGTLQRRKAVAFAVAFGIRDILQAPFLLSSTLLGADAAIWFVLASQAALVVLLAYGILQAQLFDLDLKLKWTLSRGTVATAFLLVFFVVSQLIERLASEKLGYISGAAAAGVLLLVINPLQRTADRLADKAMPKTEATPAYVAFRKMEVYKAAVEEILADGKVSDKDRRVLDRLRTQLGLAASDVGSMERDVIAAQGVA